jgi:hypothetical protein
MSRTRKTTPGYVRMLRDPNRLAKEHHDHRYGECDLDVALAKNEGWAPSTRCYLVGTHEFWMGKDGGCPCYMCHQGQWLKIERRKSRHQAKSTTNTLKKTLFAREDIDDLPYC